MIFSNIVGRFLKNKGVHVYIEAIKDLELKDVKFELVGDFGIDEDYNMFLKKLIDKTKNLTLRGFINHNYIKNYYKSIDVVVLTSTQPDSLPTVLLEGLATGKVLIGTDVGGVREIVDEQYGNILIPPNDKEALKKAIITVYNYDKDKLNYIKRKNIEKAKRLFSLDNQIKKIEKIYEELVK